MKSLKVISLFVLVITVVLLSFTSCDVVDNITGMIPGLDQLTHEHVYSDATCETPATCACGATEGEALGHSIVVDEAKDATCTEGGLTAGEHCERCDYKVEQTVTEAKGHTAGEATVENKVDPTCTEKGSYEAVYHCVDCEVEVRRSSFTIASTGHSYELDITSPTCDLPGVEKGVCSACGDTYEKELPPVHPEVLHVEAKDATCTENGNIEHWYCTTCGQAWLDEARMLNTNLLAVVLPAGHSYDEVVTAPTCTAVGYTTYTCTVCGDSYTEEIGKIPHIDENLDIDCDRDGCTGKVAPVAESVLSNFTANNLGSKLSTSSSYYVVGVIVEVLDAKNGIFLIDDGTGEKFYFRLPKNADGVSHANWEVKLVLGDKVQVYGKVNKYTDKNAPNGQYWPAIQSGVVTILEQHPHDFTFSPAGCSDPAYCACGQSYGEPLGCADTDGDNLCDDCGKNVKYVYEYIEIRTDNGSGVHDETALTYTWGNDNFGIQVAKASGGNLYVTANNHMRLYKGNQLILTNKNGIEVKTITVYLTNATQIANFEKFLTGYTYTTDAEKFSITIEINSAETITLTNPSSGGSTTQVKAIEFSYEKPSKADPVTVIMDNTITSTQSSSFTGGNDAAIVGLDPSIFTVTAGKGSYSAYAILYYKSTLTIPSQIRLYNHSSGEGNTLTVSVAEGYKILSVKINFGLAGRANGYTVTGEDGSVLYSVDTTASFSTIEEAAASFDVNGNSFVFKNVHTISNKQIWIDSIEITYQEA